MRKRLLLLVFVIGFYQMLFAQTPAWVVDESDYQYTMTFVAKINVDGKQLINVNDRVGAFVGNVCRGVSGVTYVASKKSYYAYLTVFSNNQGEAISFKIYDQSTGKITAVTKQIVFVINEHRGNLIQSYSIAEPALSSTAEILSFDFKEAPSLSTVINSGTVQVNISESYSLTKLKPVFTLSSGATLFDNGVLQVSGETLKNFSSSVNYQVLSADESTVRNYKVNVTQVTDRTLFYKKDAVCYAPGAIKVVSKREGASVQVTSNGKTIATKQIINGEALFPNLNAGSYIATLGNEWKIINIIVKDK